MGKESELAGVRAGGGGRASKHFPFDPFGSQVLDHEAIDRLRELGGEDQPELVHELIALFLSDAQQRLEDMRRALGSGDLDAIARSAHTLKSSSGSVGAVLLADLCREVEELARRSSQVELGPKTDSCIEAYGRTRDALRQLQE